MPTATITRPIICFISRGLRVVSGHRVIDPPRLFFELIIMIPDFRLPYFPTRPCFFLQTQFVRKSRPRSITNVDGEGRRVSDVPLHHLVGLVIGLFPVTPFWPHVLVDLQRTTLFDAKSNSGNHQASVLRTVVWPHRLKVGGMQPTI